MGYLDGFAVTLRQHRLFGGKRVTTSYSGGREARRAGRDTDPSADDDVKVANRVFSPSCTTGQRCTMDAVNGRNFTLKGFTVAQANIEAPTGAEARKQLTDFRKTIVLV